MQYMNEFAMKCLHPEEKNKLRNNIQREIDKIYSLFKHDYCECERCNELRGQTDFLEDMLEEIDDPFSNDYIAELLI